MIKILSAKINALRSSKDRGFTLLELLIVIGILAILSVAIVFVLNPAETLKKSRDSQRLSDLAALKTAIALYTTTVSSPDLDAAIANHCLGGSNTAAVISYSAEIADTSCTPNVAEGGDATSGSTFSTTDFCRYVGTTGAAAIDGTGWVPVNLGAITGGSPISNMPLDPTNSVATPATPSSTDFVYRYACQQGTVSAGKPSSVFEIDAVLESATYGPGGSDDRSAKDGGDNANYYEAGTSVKLIGTGTNF